LPQKTKIIDEQIQQWFYPDKGLSILAAEDEKPVFQYVRPDQFDFYFSDKTSGPATDQIESPVTGLNSELKQN